MSRIMPVYGRSGIRAYALLDADDFERFGDLRWHLGSRWGYVARRRHKYLHRLILGLDADDARRVDHINGNPLDNRKANLRLATTAQNAQNQGSRGGPSRHRGVTWDKSRQKWMASHTLNGRRTTIGRFHSEEEAGKAAAEWRRQHMPFSQEALA